MCLDYQYYKSYSSPNPGNLPGEGRTERPSVPVPQCLCPQATTVGPLLISPGSKTLACFEAQFHFLICCFFKPKSLEHKIKRKMQLKSQVKHSLLKVTDFPLQNRIDGLTDLRRTINVYIFLADMFPSCLAVSVMTALSSEKGLLFGISK